MNTAARTVSIDRGADTLAGRAQARRISLPSSAAPRLFVVVDTEEEFDWTASARRANTQVTAMRQVDRAQRIFDRFGIRPVYVVDYPVASQPDGYLPLLDILRSGRCEIGAHPHPWVNPPDLEELSGRNTFMCNLPESLQRAKLERLCERIGDVFGASPTTYKAGRYGIAESTIPLLEDFGFEADVSVCPQFDFSADHGPSFAEFDSRPFFLSDRLLEIPCTVDYTGWAGTLRPTLHRLARRDALTAFRGVGALAKVGAVNRVMLSPEGNSFGEMRALTEDLYERGLRTFMFTFHSPSLEPGHTPYVRTRADLDRFLQDIERFCEYFMGERRGIASTPGEFRSALGV